MCATCGVERDAAELPPLCPICVDERQWIPAEGQLWLTRADLDGMRVRSYLVELEPGLFGISIVGGPGLNHQAKIVVTDQGNVMVDVPAWISDDLVDQVAELGPMAAIVPSHPHMYGLQSQWSARLDAPVWLARQDLEWLGVRPGLVHEFDDTTEIVPGVTVAVPGGHFPGSIVVHWPGSDEAGVLLTGDTLGVNRDRRTTTFLRSFPNRLPLSGPDALRIARCLGVWEFDRIYDNFGGLISSGADVAVRRSAERHARWALGMHDEDSDPRATGAGTLRGGTVMRQVRTVRDLDRALDFWLDGVGLELLWHSEPDDHPMAAVGMPGAGWHLELVAGEPGSVPSDPLVLYLGAEPDQDWVRAIEAVGGLSIPLHGYWEPDWGFMDPEGYLLILSSRTWTGSHRLADDQPDGEEAEGEDVTSEQ